MRYITRNIEKSLLSYSKSFPVVALSGPRQSGKSTTLKKLFKDYKYISMDDIKTVNKLREDPVLFMDNLPEKLIIDEIQYFPDIIRNIKTKVDAQRDKKGRFILTGSSQFALIKNLSETLAGRIGILNLLPFDTTEYPHKHNISPLNKLLTQCLYSSYPEPAIRKNDFDIEGWFSSYIATYIEKDIRMVYDIGNLREFQRFIQLLATRISSLLNLSDLANELGVSVKTINRWISILEASFIITLLQPYHKNFGKRIAKHPKLYFLDCGFSSYLTGIRTKAQFLNSPFSAQLFENFCIQEIKKYICHTKKRKPNIFFFRTNYGLEVDLIIEHNFNTLSLIEFKFTKTPNKNMAKGIELLKKEFKEFKIKNCFIICLVDNEEVISQGIKAINIYDFLKEDVF